MQFIYATDLHGDINKYNKLIDLCKKYNISLIVNGGDMFPKRGDIIKEQAQFLETFLPEYFKKLREENIYYISMIGNDDLNIFEDTFGKLNDKFPNTFDIGNTKLRFGDYDFIGMNYILDTPFPRKDHIITEENFIPEEQSEDYFISEGNSFKDYTNWSKKRETLPLMKDILESLPKPDDMKKAVYITHMPPANLDFGHIKGTDRLVGSQDIYNFFKTYQPLLTLHGHLHENLEEGGKWINNIETTTSIQPGQTEKDEKEMIIVLVDLDKKEYKREVILVK